MVKVPAALKKFQLKKGHGAKKAGAKKGKMPAGLAAYLAKKKKGG